MSRRAAEKEIEAGKVKINGHPATLGDKVDPINDTVTYDGITVRAKAEKENTYIMLNKPRGYLSSLSDPHNEKCITELICDVDVRVYPVGRLDLCSEGLLLLTDDGELANLLTHPRYHIPKIYRVKVEGAVNESQYSALTSPMNIEGYITKAAEVSVLSHDESGTVMRFTLHEGRNRQIRKMCEQVGLRVKRLSRIAIGNVRLNGLSVGKWRYLEDSEVKYLFDTAKKMKKSDDGARRTASKSKGKAFSKERYGK